jgi:hypothetical protein
LNGGNIIGDEKDLKLTHYTKKEATYEHLITELLKILDARTLSNDIKISRIDHQVRTATKLLDKENQRYNKIQNKIFGGEHDI